MMFQWKSRVMCQFAFSLHCHLIKHQLLTFNALSAQELCAIIFENMTLCILWKKTSKVVWHGWCVHFDSQKWLVHMGFLLMNTNQCLSITKSHGKRNSTTVVTKHRKLIPQNKKLFLKHRILEWKDHLGNFHSTMKITRTHSRHSHSTHGAGTFLKELDILDPFGDLTMSITKEGGGTCHCHDLPYYEYI